MQNPFARVTPTQDQAARMAGLNRAFASLYEDISACVPESHYKTEALKQIEVAGMLATKGITHGAT